ncbi:ATP-binding cassette domain-containing protein, partial [Azospirillum brasilense]|nr:ATP-binding cassette domain-containing protein [Azospirillum brasilense]
MPAAPPHPAQRRPAARRGGLDRPSPRPDGGKPRQPARPRPAGGGDRLGNRHRRGGAGGRRRGAGRAGAVAGADPVGAARGGRRDAAGLPPGLLHDRGGAPGSGADVIGPDDRSPLRVEGLSLLTSRDILLDRLSFAVEPGEVLALSGGAGAGKTLLLRALSGLAPKGVTVLGDIHIQGRRILVTQDGALDPLRTIGAQFTELLAHQSGMDERTALRCAAEALERFQVPAAARRLALHPHELGEAMRWRAALALAMAAEPALLLADAPAAALDPTQRVRLLSDLAAWTREAGTALLLAGRPQPDPIQADPVPSGLADRRLILAQGRLE